MNNSDTFLRSFTTIEKWLRSVTGLERNVRFYQLVDRASEHRQDVKRYRDDLKEFADLRNAIVHERTDGHTIAEPNSRAVGDIKRLESLLLSPPKVLPAFQRKVATAEASWPIAKAVSLMATRAFSQLPVIRNGKFEGLLTANTIARWLGYHVDDKLVALDETTIAEVLRYTEVAENHQFVGREASLFDILASFDRFEAKGLPLDAVLITQHGKSGEAFLGVIALYDVPKILGMLRVKPAA